MRHSGLATRLRATFTAGFVPAAAVAAERRSLNLDAAELAGGTGGPLTLLSAVPTSAVMMTPPAATTDQRTETWLWILLSEAQIATTITYDTIAFRLSRDCTAMTGERPGDELYRDVALADRAPPRSRRTRP